MRDNRLISMVDFVLEQSKEDYRHIHTDQVYQQAVKYNRCRAYAKFLSQPLTLGMFVPCDENGEVLEEPSMFKEWIHGFRDDMDKHHDLHHSECSQFQQAKDRVLFEGFDLKGETMYFAHGFIEFDKNGIIYILGDSGSYKAHTIEDVMFCQPTLTKNALKTIYG